MIIVASFTAVVLLLTGCSPAPQKQSGKLRVLTTLWVLADWARQVGGGRVVVGSLLRGPSCSTRLKPAAGTLRRCGTTMPLPLPPLLKQTDNYWKEMT